MSGAVQNTIVVLAVLAAVGYLARTGWQALRLRRAGCGACSHCPGGATSETAAGPAANPEASPAVVTLGLLHSGPRTAAHATGNEAAAKGSSGVR